MEGSKVDTAKESIEQEGPSFSIKPTLYIILCAFLGLCLGIGLADGRGSAVFISWVKLPGDLFIRSLNCIVLPLVFVNIMLAIVDMIKAGKASSVGSKTIGLYALTTILASIEGLLFVLMFRSKFSNKNESNEVVDPLVLIKCPFNSTTNEELWLQEQINGKVICGQRDENSTGAVFLLNNTNDYLTEVEDKEVEDDITFSQTLQDGIFRKMVSANIIQEFIQGNFVGIIVFAIFFAIASQSLTNPPQMVIVLMEEMNRLFLKTVDWIIKLTPIAVLSLIAGNLGEQDDLISTFKDIGVLMACSLLAMSFHFFVVYPLLYLLFVKENPIPYFKFLIPAQIFGFASSSSAATLPLSLECVAASKQVPKSVANFVLSMGSTLNMDGGAIYFPASIVFLAIADGLEDQLNGATYFLILLLSTIGSAGTAPVPSASLVLIITAYNTAFDTSGTPEAFGLILAVDWFINRFRVVLNVTGDMAVARMVAATADIHDEDDLLENEVVASI